MSLYMREFLKQFKLLDNFAVQHRNLKNPELLEEAKELGFIKDWIPDGGRASCTYYRTSICTPKGRLFVKNLTIEEKLEIKRLRKIALAGQQIVDHRAAIDKINKGRAAAGQRIIGVQSA